MSSRVSISLRFHRESRHEASWYEKNAKWLFIDGAAGNGAGNEAIVSERRSLWRSSKQQEKFAEMVRNMFESFECARTRGIAAYVDFAELQREM
jgi:hypothetical protein